MQKPAFRFARRMVAALLLFAAASTDAYFLSWQQKGALLLDGRVSDSRDNIYNIRILHGYRPAAQLSRDQWASGYASQKTGVTEIGTGLLEIPASTRHFGKFIGGEPYAGMAHGLEQAWNWEKYLYTEFMGRELAGAWSLYMGNARTAHQRRSFAWWLSYPWATAKGVTNTAMRVAVGVPASVLAAGYGLALRPAYEVAVPVGNFGYDAASGVVTTVTGVGRTVIVGTVIHQGGGGTVAPLLSTTWTTAAGIPMGLAGRAPTPRSVDGWWVVMLPGSPDYDKSIDKDSRMRLENFGEVLRYELDRHRLQASIDSLQAERDSTLNELSRLRAQTWASYNVAEAGLRRDILGGRVFHPERHRTRPLSAEEQLYLHAFLRSTLDGEPYFAALPDSTQAALLTVILQTWGASILATPKKDLESPFDRTGPETILREEAEQIFKPGAGETQ